MFTIQPRSLYICLHAGTTAARCTRLGVRAPLSSGATLLGRHSPRAPLSWTSGIDVPFGARSTGRTGLTWASTSPRLHYPHHLSIPPVNTTCLCCLSTPPVNTTCHCHLRCHLSLSLAVGCSHARVHGWILLPFLRCRYAERLEQQRESESDGLQSASARGVCLGTRGVCVGHPRCRV